MGSRGAKKLLFDTEMPSAKKPTRYRHPLLGGGTRRIYAPLSTARKISERHLFNLTILLPPVERLPCWVDKTHRLIRLMTTSYRLTMNIMAEQKIPEITK